MNEVPQDRGVTATVAASYYRARYYDANVGRFVSEDLLKFESGDVNLYPYVRNSPINLIDPSGLTWQSNWNFFWDFALGIEPRTRDYGSNDIQTQEMKNSIGVNKLRQFFYHKNCQDVTRYGYGTTHAAWDTGLNPFAADWSSTAFQVGAWGSCLSHKQRKRYRHLYDFEQGGR